MRVSLSSIREDRPGPKWQARFRNVLALLQGVVSLRRVPGKARVRALGQEAPPAHAGVDAGLRGTCRAGRWRRPGRAFPEPVPPATLRHGLLPGRVVRTEPGLSTQLRLQPLAVRRHPPVQLLESAGDRHERLPVGACSTASTTPAWPFPWPSEAGESWVTASAYP